MIEKLPEINFPEGALIPWISKTSKMLRLHLKERFAEKGFEITKEQYILLAHLNHKDGWIQKELAFITNRNKGSLARLVSTAERKNLVKRIASKTDKRINRIYLTEHGKSVFKKLKPIIEKSEKQVQKGITKKEYELMVSLIKKIQNNISS